jgi:hypothetical protein
LKKATPKLLLLQSNIRSYTRHLGPDSPADFVVFASVTRMRAFRVTQSNPSLAENLRKDGLLRRPRRLSVTTLDSSVFSGVGIT